MTVRSSCLSLDIVNPRVKQILASKICEITDLVVFGFYAEPITCYVKPLTTFSDSYTDNRLWEEQTLKH